MVLSKYPKSGFIVEELIKQKILSNSSNELLIIVPTNRKSRHLRKELLKLSPEKAMDNIFVETLTTISQEILFAAGFSFSLPSESVSSVLLEQCFKEMLYSKSEFEVKYFFNFQEGIPKGSLDKIRAAISEYKRHGISPSILERELNELRGIEANKASDIINVYKLLNNKYLSLDLKDTGDIYNCFLSLTPEILSESFRLLFPHVNLIVLQDFSDFSKPEINIINSLANITKTELFLDIDFNYSNHHLFSHLSDSIQQFSSMGFAELYTAKVDGNLFNKFISENLFNYARPHSSDSDSITQNRCVYFSADDKTEEVTIIAKEIKGLITNEKVPPHHIGIVFNLIQDYSPIIRDIFSSYGIPFNLTDRYNLSSFSPVTTIITLLEIIETDFYYKSLFRVLSNELVRLPNVNINDILSAASELRIISGYKNWARCIDKQIDILQKDKAEDKRIEYYNNIKAQIEHLFNLLSPFLSEMAPEDFYKALEKLVVNINLPHSELIYNYESAEINLKALDTFFSTVKELLTLFSFEYPKDQKFTLSFYLENIRTAVSNTRFNLKEKSNFGVQITTFEEVRGLKFDYLFISGLYDDNIPTKYNPEIFTLKKYAKGEQKHNRLERYLFYKVLTSFTTKVYLSHPRNDAEKELIPSVFLKELLNLISPSLLNTQHLTPLIYSEFALKTEMGKSKQLMESCLNSNNPNTLSKLLEQVTIDTHRIVGDYDQVSEYSGMIKMNRNERILESLSSAYLKNYSISQLETYAKCPFKFFMERVLTISIVDEPSEEIESIEMGDLLHRTLYHFSMKLKEMGIVLFNCSDSDYKIAKTLLFGIAKDIFEEFEFNSESDFFEFEKVFGIEGKESNSILSKFLEFERNNDLNEIFTPELFEEPFGKLKDEDGKDSSIYNFSFDDIKLRGKIDRIDVGKEYGVFRVIDYKLGKKNPSKKYIDEGIELQLPVYLYAAKRILEKKHPDLLLLPALAGLFSLRLKSDDFGFNSISIDRRNISLLERITNNKSELIEFHNSLIDKTLQIIKNYIKNISEGKYPISSLPERESFVCKYCSFITVCRKDEVLTSYSTDEE